MTVNNIIGVYQIRVTVTYFPPVTMATFPVRSGMSLAGSNANLLRDPYMTVRVKLSRRER